MKLTQSIETLIPFVERAQLRVLHLETGKVTCEMPLEPNANHMNSMYAGAQFTLADITGGALMLATFGMKTCVPTLKELTMNYVKPATSSLQLSLQLTSEQIAEMNQALSSDHKARVELKGDLIDQSGDIVSQMTGTFVVLRKTETPGQSRKHRN